MDTLDISSNKFSKLPEVLGDLKGLTHFNAEYNGIRQLPQSFAQLHSLKILILSDNPALNLVPDYDNFPGLNRLHMRNLQLPEISPSLGTLQQLQELEMSNNSHLKGIPQEIGQLVNLSKLDLYGNKLKILPPTIGNLKNLKILDLRQNCLSIETLPAQLGNLVGLERIFLANNKLGNIPQEVLSMKNLKVLDMSNNELHDIPEQLCVLTGLTKLNLSGNALKRLPGALSGLGKLEILDVKHNEMAKLPEELCTCTTLRKIDMSHNMLTEVPWEYGKLETTLKVFDVQYNPLVVPPRPIVDQGTTVMLRWLSRNEEKGRAARNKGGLNPIV
jgi:Leucine-rich repeat (LRR) protein